MFRMEVDSPSSDAEPVSPQDCIVQRLGHEGVPAEYLEKLQPGLTAYFKDNRSRLPNLFSAILPTDEEGDALDAALTDHFQESMVWLQWLMFEGDPDPVLKNLALSSVGQRGVCGAVWGNNDIAYRCRTCEHDPTCAICVPCFQNGNHKDHDYSIIYTGGGCCDCGDVTAWKREGFCSKHKGAEQIQPLQKDLAISIGPVVDLLFNHWKNSLTLAESLYDKSPNEHDHAVELKFADCLTSAIVILLLDFCKCSESLLSFISARVLLSVGLLDVLVRAERFLSDEGVRELQELLLKMLSEPIFKFEFANVFLDYYPTVVSEAIKENNDAVFKKWPLLSTFSVQIFTVPTLTPRLVKERDLLVLLLECLGNIFFSCAGEDGQLQVNKWGNLYDLTLRVVEDIRFVMSHAIVPKYVTRDRRDIVKMWMKLLTSMQGMNPQKRETGMHIEEENDTIHLPFVLGHSIANIHSLLVAGAFSESSAEEKNDENFFNTYKSDYDDQDSPRHAKVGRHSKESSVSSATGRHNILGSASRSADVKSDVLLGQPAISCLTFECLNTMESWLRMDNTSGTLPREGNMLGNNFSAIKKRLLNLRKGNSLFRSYDTSSVSRKFMSISEHQGRQHSSIAQSGETGVYVGIDLATGRVIKQDAASAGFEENSMETENANELEALRVLSLSDWPDVSYDVSSQDISVHIPLHRLLSMILQRAVRKCYGELSSPNPVSISPLDPSSSVSLDFFGHILCGCHPHGFSAFVMEHPLRIRVFCAQVHAGMWRKNGDAAILSWEWYRSVRWCEQGLELDLFLLQCCAALAPADLYVSRILERFGLSNYLSLNLERSSEYEQVLMQEMLMLIIQIVKERRFCGLSAISSLERELVYKLAIGNATRSQLVKSLPRDLSKMDCLQEILDRVAVYSNPSGMNQGMYKLRLEYWRQLDMYHPRWNSRDLQSAEEHYMRFCKTSALTSQLPKWTKIYAPFSGIARVATCKVVLQLVRAVLFYAVYTDNSIPSRAPDSVLPTALHLLSLALDICFQQRESGSLSGYTGNLFPVLAFAGQDIPVKHANGVGDESLLSLLVSLMKMHRKEKSDNLSEAGSFNLSSLIECLLKRFAELNFECMTKLQKLAPEVVSQLSHSIHGSGTCRGRPASEDDERKAKARERQAAILEKMRAQQSKFLENVKSTATDELDGSKSEASPFNIRMDTEEPAQDICSLCHDPNSKNPLCFLILLQKSMLQSLVDRGPPSWKKKSCSDKEHFNERSHPSDSDISTSNLVEISSSQLDQLLENAISELASDGNSREVKAFVEFIRARFPPVRNIQFPSISDNASKRTASSLEALEEQIYLAVCKQTHGNLFCLEILEHDHRFLVAELSSTSGVSESLFLGKYIATLSKEILEKTSASESTHSQSPGPSESSNSRLTYDGFGPLDCDGIYVSSCGHKVHQACLDSYLSSVKERHLRRIVFEGGQIVDPNQGEFLCPVCRGLANSVLPALPGDQRIVIKKPGDLAMSWSYPAGCLASENKTTENLCLREAMSLLHSAADVAGREEILKALPIHQIGQKSPNLDSVFRVLSGMYFADKQDKILGSERIGHSMIMWDTIKYSLISTEIASRCRRSSLAPNFSLDSLFKELKSSNGFILSLLLRTVRGLRSKNSLIVLLRLRGIQHFAESICSGASLDDFASHSLKQGGSMESILKTIGREMPYPDIEFWKRASEPILASDAFSSLMWVLFCLPSQFLSSEDTFLSLVHIFYGVSVIQAIITYFGKSQCKATELGHKDILVKEIFNSMQGCGFAKQYLISDHINHSFDIKANIRGLNFPYLRRCGLLWKVMNSSSSAPFSDEALVHNSSSHAIDEIMEDVNDNIVGDVEVEELEKMFKIPSLDVVLNDEVLCSLLPRWLCHFNNEYEVRYAQTVLPLTPAVPFKLMHLPNVYQDLLQRYIKQHCPYCDSALEEPALCLLCGRLCSPNWKRCCRESGCQTHATTCGAGIGVFLLIRKTNILLQRAARLAAWPSPYLDAFGEEDHEMRRGKPLYLNEERYAALTYMVASHGLDRSSKVLRQTTVDAVFLL